MNAVNPPLLILYDGVCGLCNRLNTFVLKRDRRERFRFASLQSETARQLLLRHGYDPEDLNTLYVVSNHQRSDEKLFKRSEAVSVILNELGRGWKTIARILGLLPRGVRDSGYNLVARTRYKIFGKYETCQMPAADWRAKFLDI